MKTLLLAVMLLLVGCAKSTTEDVAQVGSAPAWSVLDDWVGKSFTVTGLAGNAKAGAVIEGENAIVYVAGLESWPAAIRGKTVRATGTLVKKVNLAPSADERGGVSPGIPGEQYIIENAKWEMR